MSEIVRRTLQAIVDLECHAAYLGRQSEALELRFLEAARDTFLKLARSPELGAIYPFENEQVDDLRVWRVKGFRNHLVFYRKIPDGIEVIRIFHAAQDWMSAFVDDRS